MLFFSFYSCVCFLYLDTCFVTFSPSLLLFPSPLAYLSTGIFVERARVDNVEDGQGIILNDFADEIILDPRLIAKQYMKTWFFLDLLSSVPMDYIFLMWDAEANLSQLFHAGTNADTSRQETPPYWQGDHSPHN
ncbi:potassium/sodium hyperpolarization-activated cyclic nucleotide-gated channel 2 [Plakobranchus ocellatus]|uniref:Potassium/sodium hyperpolarization-activated cyclic nucleotide-gated channel 2 n=1 Tax=Plakobranchus ocellatus TaxID=259542 RepID=A0AAV4AUB1_9GAST|nr:potassium/sodium hyperpolarization-activated cyclic nucleotide-gated channel 2 [Plakobranchus ocellatus]